MIKEIIATGKDIIEAKENARAALGAGPLDDVNFEILHAGSKGIFGLIGVKPAQVKASMEIPDAPERKKFDRKPREDRPAQSDEKNEKRENNNNNNNGGKRRNDKKRPERRKQEPIPPMPPKNESSKPKSVVIPESQLKFEPRVVADGEDMSYEFVKTLLSNIGLSATAELFSCDDGTRRINITGEDASVLIGHHGDTLDALQYLANLASAQKNMNGEKDKSRVTIDVEGYRAKREETLRALARRMAAKALKNKRSVMLEPMSAYERRIIHSEIQGIEGVSTNSIGADNNRKIVIYLTDKKPEGIFEDDEETVTPLNEEFAPNEEEASTEAVEATLTTGDSADETVAVEQTTPAEEIESAPDDDSDIK